MSTTRGANKSRHWVFTGRRKRTGRHKKYAALPVSKPYRRSIRFQGLPKTVKKKRELFPGLSPTSPILFVLPLIIHVLVREY
jgi:hypothetical protein